MCINHRLCFILTFSLAALQIGYAQVFITKIADARKLRDAQSVTVAGRVSASKVFGDLTFVQDDSGGIPLFDRSTSERLSPGDSVIVSGKIAYYRSMIEVLPSHVTLVRTGQPPNARVVSPSKLTEFEGTLVEIRSIAFEHRRYLYPQQEVIGVSGADTARVWIDGDTNLPGCLLPATSTLIRGVVISFDGRIQLMPRFHADIEGSKTPVTPARGPLSLRVLTWNVQFLGATKADFPPGFGPDDEGQQLTNVATILRHAKADLIALQEVTTDAVLDDLLDRLPGYEGKCSNRYSRSYEKDNDFPPQRLCILYRNDIIRPSTWRPLFEKLYDRARVGESALLNSAPGGASSAFASGRLPFVMEFQTSLATNVNFSIVNIHAKSGASADDRLRREFDAGVLKDSLDKYFSTKNVLLVGDFNDDLDKSISSNGPSPYKTFVDDKNYVCISHALTTNGWQSTLNYTDMIDHQVILGTTLLDSYRSIWVLNPFHLVARFGASTSDHLPVVSDFSFAPTTITGLPEVSPVAIYPNPTNGQVFFSVPDNQVTALELASQLGTTLLSVRGSQSDISQRCSEILEKSTPGLYLVKICTESFCRTFRLLLKDVVTEAP